MTEQEIKAEHDRLRPIVFEGAPDGFKWASMDWNGDWFLYKMKPEINKANMLWIHTQVKTTSFKPCVMLITQHKTSLNWKQTLIERGFE